MPQSDGLVHGVLYQISREQWTRLDQYERDWGYFSMACQAETHEGKRVQALAHTLSLEAPFCSPTEDFLNLMLQGAHELGYGPHVVQAIRRAAAGENSP